MAKLPEPQIAAFSDLGEPPPKGTYLAVCLDVVDQYGVERNKWKSEERETVNLTWFIFGVKLKNGELRKIRTHNLGMKISNDPKSTLHQFLASWLGEAPKSGFDTATLKGKGAQLTVVERESGDKTYMNIGTCTEVMEELQGKVPKVEDFGTEAANDNTGAEIPF
jgi:hypothetical protein